MALIVFLLVYLGMILGRLPRLQLDRTGVALLGAIALLAAGVIDTDTALHALDIPTLALLFGLMVVSAQLRLGGFYDRITLALAELPLGPAQLLAALVLVAGVLSAIFSNDIVCLAMTPILITAMARRNLDPVPFLLALACAANIGSAATLIGNPQNMLIGQSLQLGFGRYLGDAGPTAAIGLAATWGIIVWQSRDRWQPIEPPASAVPAQDRPVNFNRWQTAKGLTVAAALMLCFLLTSWPREIVTLAAAGLLLTSRKLHSRTMLGLIDWQLLVLFIGLFVVNDAFARTGLPARLVADLVRTGFDPQHPGLLFPITVVLSNAVSNVPAVMLLLPLTKHPMAGTILALASTLAGNLLVVGSIANIIVVDIAAQHGVVISWRRHARTGIPVTIATLSVAAAMLWLIVE